MPAGDLWFVVVSDTGAGVEGSWGLSSGGDERNGLTDSGIKRDIWLYASIPPVAIYKLLYEYGINIFNRNDVKRAVEVINRDFPYLKTTNKTHTITH